MAKRIGFTLLQLLVTAAGIYYVFHDPQKQAEIGHALRGADWRWLALSWLVYGAVEALATLGYVNYRNNHLEDAWQSIQAATAGGNWFTSPSFSNSSPMPQ